MESLNEEQIHSASNKQLSYLFRTPRTNEVVESALEFWDWKMLHLRITRNFAIQENILLRLEY